MKYVSTHGTAPPQEFCDILLGGLAPDGGLYLPETYPKIADRLEHWRELSYAELAFEILSLFATDIPPNDLREICEKTYRPEIFCHRDPLRAHGCEFDGTILDIAPLTWLERTHVRGRKKPVAGWALLELSNGPTLAFKDQAMQLLGNLFEYVLKKRSETINILGATSGDTGSAAEYALRGKEGVRVIMLSPEGKMSAFQRAQMYSLQDANIFNVAVHGMFDDAQDMVKAVSNDAAFKAKYRIGAVNSINWARVAAQIVYYVKAYFAATEKNDERVNFAIPTGNFGNICAGHIARMMGLPIGELLLATNENDVLGEFFRTGIYRPRDTANTYVTSSPSMDISKASNFERFVFDLMGRDAFNLRHLFALLDTSKKDMPGFFDLSDWSTFRNLRRFGITSDSVSHAQCVGMIRKVYKTYGLIIDPHTAVAAKMSDMCRRPGEITVFLETASPVKFQETIREAIGQDPVRPSEFNGIEGLPQRVEEMDANVGAIKAYIAKICHD
jgi:threonine synthase